jgi:NAD-dependent deacetylase
MTDLARGADLIARARYAVALTGAGISTESGIPDFRGAGGVWSRYDPEEFSLPSFLGRASARRKYWAWEREFDAVLQAARPNRAHLALAELERRGTLRCVITQNVDGLHQAAGSEEVIELHGSAQRVICTRCEREIARAEAMARLAEGHGELRCEFCAGDLKPGVVLFGEPMPMGPTRRAFDEAESADLFLAIGSSLVVHPAAALVPAARAAGAALMVINLTPTPYDELADVVLHSPAGETLAALVGPDR